jgi:hypothetical protein
VKNNIFLLFLECGGKFVSHSGVITSPNYPQNYLPNYECFYYIQVSDFHLVNLTFGDFGITKLEPNCSKLGDYVKVMVLLVCM